MKKIESFTGKFLFLLLIAVMPFLGGCSQFENYYNKLSGKQNGDVDLAEAIPLIAQAVPHPDGGGNGPGGTTEPTLSGPLFDLQPGTFVSLQTLTTKVDATGTTIANDYDGDGLLNDDEYISNIWVADYPDIQASIATPVTMRIEILENSEQTSDQIVSDINSEDTEATSSDGSERIHQTETALKTREFQDSYSKSNEESHSFGESEASSLNISAPGSVAQAGGFGFGTSESSSNQESWSKKTGYSETTTKWKDVPFKNNLDNNNWRVKSNNAAKKARNFRSEYTTKINSTSKVDANAGYVRAALYIKNLSVDMPVHLSNILCTLMFETPDGTLLPVQSFRLRNNDFSIFEVEVYGGNQFGPYVIELNGLNTNEIKNAIALGYSPKIFVVDYDMTHVPNSTYRSRLANYSGDNLKIVEENTKGRSALFRVIGPNLRKKYRVAAFSFHKNLVGDDGRLVPNPDHCKASQGELVAPGIPLFEALRRLNCSGTGLNIEFGDYLIDMHEKFPELGEDSRILVRGIKSVGGTVNKLPMVPGTCGVGIDGNPALTDICIHKPISEWSDAEKEESGMWAIFVNGKIYNHTEYLPEPHRTRDDLSAIDPEFVSIPVVKGVESMIWAGDQYDLVYIRFKDLIDAETSHGNNPFETKEPVAISTGWDSHSLGVNPFDPNVNSLYLGQAGFNERIMLKFDLKDTWYLNPSFGYPSVNQNVAEYANFSYNSYNTNELFTMYEAVDFEFTLGLGGERSDWFHVLKDIRSWSDPSDPNAIYPADCGYFLDYVNQTFTLCINLPARHENPLIDTASSVLNIYLRPALNTAYRQTVWPKHKDDVNEFDGIVADKLTASTLIKNVGSGTIAVDDTVKMQTVNGGEVVVESLKIATLTELQSSPPLYEVTFVTDPLYEIKSGAKIWKPLATSLIEPDVVMSIDLGFYTEWNKEALTNPLLYSDYWRNNYRVPLMSSDYVDCNFNIAHSVKCLGFNTHAIAGNWMGSYNYGIPNWNRWADGGNFSSFISGGLPKLTTANGYNLSIKGSKPSILPSSDTPLSGNNFSEQLAPHIDGDGTRAVAVWVSFADGSPAIMGQMLDGNSGAKLGDEFPVSMSNAEDRRNWNPKVSVSGSRAIVVWESSNDCDPITVICGDVDIRGRVIDLAAGIPAGFEFDVNLSHPDNKQLFPAVKAVNGKALVAWHSRINANTAYTMGRLLNINEKTPTVDGADLQLSELQDVDDWQGACVRYHWGIKAFGCAEWNSYHTLLGRIRIIPAVDEGSVGGSNTRFVTVWSAKKEDLLNPGIIESAIRYRIVKTDGNMIGDKDLPISEVTQNYKHSPVIKVRGDYALVAWVEHSGLDATTDSDIRARLLNIATNKAVAPVQDVGTTNPGLRQIKPHVDLSGTMAVLTWESENDAGTYDVHGRVFNMVSTSFVDFYDFMVNSGGGVNRNPRVSTNGNHAAFIWEKMNPVTGDYDIYGTLRDIVTKEMLNRDFKVSFSNTGDQLNAATWMNDDNAFLVWQSADNGTDFDIRFGMINIGVGSVYGLNNFFVAPLIKRDFTVQAEVLLGQ